MIYSTLMVLIVSLIDLIAELPLRSMLCASDDWIEAGGPVTTFCKAQGNFLNIGHVYPLFTVHMHAGGLLVFSYLVIPLLWLFQIMIHFWLVIYPMHYHSFVSTGKLKFIHVTVVAISFLLPVIPLLAADFDNEFGTSVIHTRKCLSLIGDFIFYGIIVPLDVIVAIGLSLLIITLWSIGNVVSFH